jgi:16S rRNA (guanine527-N7)-methyltransferase
VIEPEDFDPRLRAALERARTAGFLGPGDLDVHVQHAVGFARVIEGALDGPPSELCDLGPGGGPPGLLLAACWPTTTAVLVESNQRRAQHLSDALAELGWHHRVRIVTARAEVVAHQPEHRERFTAVTARGFGPPAVTAEIAAGLVAVSGVLVTSEPPEPDADRWPPVECASLGFGAAELVAPEAHYAILRKVAPAPPDVPRGVGRPGKRPRW